MSHSDSVGAESLVRDDPESLVRDDPTSDIAEAKLNRQQDLEDRAVARGVYRFDRRLETAKEKGRGSTFGAAKRLLSEGMPKLEAALEAWLEDQTTGRGRRHTLVPYLEALGCDQAAAVTLKLVLDRLHEPVPHRKLAAHLSNHILMELRSRRLQKEAPGLFHYRMRSFRGTAHYRHMKNSMSATIRYSEVDVSDLEMTRRQAINCGAKLLEILEMTLGLIEAKTVTPPTGKLRQEIIVEFDAETRAWMAERNGLLREAYPVYGPMVVPPLAWSKGERGGYRFALRAANRLVRGGSEANRQENDLSDVYKALNAVQETPWCVNLAVLDVLQGVVERDGGRAGVPSLEKVPMPPKPHDIDSNEEAKAAWKEQAHRRHLRERERQSDAAVFLRTLNIAEELADEEELYWPHNLDWRGRVYPIPDTLHPQGPDLHRGLLMFTEGVPLGRDGAMWLAVHGANCIGEASGRKLDKKPLQERVDWVVQNSARIKAVADDPEGVTWWQDADEPWQALAFCFEWARFIRHRQRGRKDRDFVSRLPVHQDGTCNGLQHLSALLRDEAGGAAVNLTPSDTPQDFYAEVLDETIRNLETIVRNDDESRSRVAAMWLASGWLDRSMVKRPAMTFGYGSRAFGFANQIEEHLRSEVGWFKVTDYFDTEDTTAWGATRLLAGAIFNAIGREADGAARAMTWMQEASRAVAKAGRPVEWEVPATGFRVSQYYRKTKLRQVKTILSGTVLKPSYHDELDEVDTKKQASAAPPNIVHSLDAANLVLTVCQAVDDGVRSFAVVHDSFATHAGNMTLLSRAIRQGFVELHQHPVLPDLEAQFLTMTDEEVPEPPTRGRLDLGRVLVSTYFFS